MAAITIAIVNEKGGVGKTTTTVSLGAAYARAGMRTLLIDMDPQASLTRGLIGSVWTCKLPAEATAAVLFDEGLVMPSDRIIQDTRFDGLSLLPGSRALKAMNRLEPEEYGTGQFALRELIDNLHSYDRILIDNPPNLEFCSWASMMAADFVLLPLQAEDYGAQGVQFVNQAVAAIRAAGNPGLQILGYLRTLYQKRAAVHIAYSQKLRSDFPGMLLEGFIPHAAQFREALMAQTPLPFFRPRCAAAIAVAGVVEEMEKRISRLRSTADQSRKEVI